MIESIHTPTLPFIASTIRNSHSPVNITAREMQVLDLISYGLTTKEIASDLYVSAHTIISHRKNLLEKLDAPNVAGMIRRAFEVGILSIQT